MNVLSQFERYSGDLQSYMILNENKMKFIHPKLNKMERCFDLTNFSLETDCCYKFSRLSRPDCYFEHNVDKSRMSRYYALRSSTYFQAQTLR